MWPFTAPYPGVSCKALASEYDYIIVGGGTAGCVLANRLSADPSVSVLLVERGRADDTWLSRVPLFSNPFSPWPPAFDTQVDDSGSQKEKEKLYTGNALGGTSRINAMLYTRGLAGEYDGWSGAGRKGWRYEELVPLFGRSERCVVKEAGEEAGRTGEWIVNDHGEPFFQHTAHLRNACEDLGFPYLSDINTSSTPAYGCAKTYFTITPDGTRHSTFHAFLPTSLADARRQRLHVCTGTIATKLQFARNAGGKPRVCGVVLRGAEGEGVGAGVGTQVGVKREVVLCSGPFGNPKLLQLSGIGPSKVLKPLGIPVIKDLPGVGAHLQDHTAGPLVYTVPLHDSLVGYERPLPFLIELLKYVFSGKGLLRCPVLDFTIFARSQCLDAQTSRLVTTPNLLT
ncbi:hypothetical protein EIP91_003658 [Steccherinum ochraceum]|uniref:Glucose-methanol-choline oxidoreductase N-terminal domain-containing protein n=1 Tax=Steccherinum ochraceum TaxID=92696 RepID=A0A4V2MW37_9APHY|nr:hypothetical protein EIP91_003658 [Steccherinum ochraceum]